MLSSASDKTKLFAKNFSNNSNLDDSDISLPVFPRRTNLKLHNISVTPKIVNSSIFVSRSLVFQIVGRPHWWSLYCKNIGE